MANNSGASRREAMRLKAAAEEARGRRNSRILWISLAAVAVAVVVILALVVSKAMTGPGPISQEQAPRAEQQTPPNATESNGIEIKTQDVEPADDVPHLRIYEDPQCPGCAQTEGLFGPSVLQLIDEGKITAEVITAHFLDDALRNDASERAAIAGAAADAVGKYREFHTVMYENQPEEVKGGPGYTDEQLRVDFPALAGIEGEDLTAFQKLYDGRAFADFASDSDDQFVTDKISGTPTYKVGENKLEFVDDSRQPLIEPTAEDLLRAINEANA